MKRRAPVRVILLVRDDVGRLVELDHRGAEVVIELKPPARNGRRDVGAPLTRFRLHDRDAALVVHQVQGLPLELDAGARRTGAFSVDLVAAEVNALGDRAAVREHFADALPRTVVREVRVLRVRTVEGANLAVEDAQKNAAEAVEVRHRRRVCVAERGRCKLKFNSWRGVPIPADGQVT